MLRAILRTFRARAVAAAPVPPPRSATFADALARRAEEWTARMNKGAFALPFAPMPMDLQSQAFVVCLSISTHCGRDSFDPVTMPFRNQQFINTSYAFVLLLVLRAQLRDEGRELDADDFTARFIPTTTMLTHGDLHEAAETVLSARRAAMDIAQRYAEPSHAWHGAYTTWHEALSRGVAEYLRTGEDRWLEFLTPVHRTFANGLFAAYLVARAQAGDPVVGLEVLAASPRAPE